MKATRTLDDYDTRTLDRMLAKREITEAGCWEWTGCANTANLYGRVGYRGATWYTHRLIYTLTRGEIADPLVVDHLCRNRICFNPDHLELVTRRENTLRGETLPADQISRTHCPKGHPYDEENTFRGQGGRVCIQCRRASQSAKSVVSPKTPCPTCGRDVGGNRWGAPVAHMMPGTNDWCYFRRRSEAA